MQECKFGQSISILVGVDHSTTPEMNLEYYVVTSWIAVLSNERWILHSDGANKDLNLQIDLIRSFGPEIESVHFPSTQPIDEQSYLKLFTQLYSKN